jgi:hypothetical protein
MPASLCSVKCGKLGQRRGPVLEVDADQPLLPHVADDVPAVVDQEFDAMLLHETGLVLAVTAEEPALLGQPGVDTRSPETLTGCQLGLQPAEAEEVNGVSRCQTAKALQTALQPLSLCLVVCSVSIGTELAGEQDAPNVRCDRTEGHCRKGKRVGKRARERLSCQIGPPTLQTPGPKAFNFFTPL